MPSSDKEYMTISLRGGPIFHEFRYKDKFGNIADAQF